MPSRLTMLPDNESLMCLGPSTIIIVLSVFNIKNLGDIQFLLSLNHDCRLANQCVSSGFIDKYSCVMCITVKMYGVLSNILPKGAIYRVNNNGPSTEPYGTP